MWSVRVLSGPQTGKIFDLKLGKNIFGRSAGCDIKIQSIGISKEHCEIHVYKDKAILVDLKSSNGTFLNGVKIQNSIIKLGDKFSLFDIIMDVIPQNEIKLQRPVAQMKAINHVTTKINEVSSSMVIHGANAMQTAGQPNALYPQMQQHLNVVPNEVELADKNDISTTGKPQLSLKEKLENYIENVVMPVLYKLAVVIPFKQVLFGFVLIFVLLTTFLSVIPLSTIIKESNLIEATKRAKSVARALAKQNELALSSGQFVGLSVTDALKEDGIEEALIIQQSDGAILAPSEKAGREMNRPFIDQIRKEPRASSARVNNTLVASFPIGAPDPNTGELSVKYHTVVYYKLDSLNVDDGRILSLLMQTLVISALLGSVVYFLFSRMIQFPLSSLNRQIDIALREKSDRTEVFFDYPVFQQLVANVNLLLNRIQHSQDQQQSTAPKQNRDVEMHNVVDMITQPAFVLSENQSFLAINDAFEQLMQVSKDNLLHQSYTQLTDGALQQNIEALIIKANSLPFERHSDRIPFSQFECEISLQALLNQNAQPEYYLITLQQVGGE